MSLGTNKLGITVFAFAVALSCASGAWAQTTGLYFTPKVGYSHLQADNDSGSVDPIFINKASKGRVALGLAVGYDFNSVYEVPIRAEVEYAWRAKKDWGNTKKSTYDEIASRWVGGLYSLVDEVGVQSLFANFYLDIHNFTTFTPYIGGGLGVAHIEADFLKGFRLNSSSSGVISHGDTVTPVMMKKTSTNFAWNIGAGVAWAINDNISLDAGYRYADFGNIGIDNKNIGGYALEADITTHEVLLGLRYTF